MTASFEPLTCRAFAKINLRLRILGLRPDGFHDLDTTFQTIALHDILRFEPVDGHLRLTLAEPSAVPTDRSNLVWRAAAAVWKAMGRSGDPSGVAIRLEKRIPAQAGLGGGSSDAALTLRALARIWNADLSPGELHALGRTLGADVPFFFHGGTARATGRGDVIEPLVDLPPRQVVLVLPSFGVPTADAYRWWDEDGQTAGLPVVSASDVANDFADPVERRHPLIREIKQTLLNAGASAAAMSGSGSAVFGMFESAGAAAGAAAAIEGHGWASRVTATLDRESFARGSGLV